MIIKCAEKNQHHKTGMNTIPVSKAGVLKLQLFTRQKEALSYCSGSF